MEIQLLTGAKRAEEIKGINLKEKRMKRKNLRDVEDKGHNGAVCGRMCASVTGFAAHRCSFHPQ